MSISVSISYSKLLCAWTESFPRSKSDQPRFESDRIERLISPNDSIDSPRISVNQLSGIWMSNNC